MRDLHCTVVVATITYRFAKALTINYRKFSFYLPLCSVVVAAITYRYVVVAAITLTTLRTLPVLVPVAEIKHLRLQHKYILNYSVNISHMILILAAIELNNGPQNKFYICRVQIYNF